jgi:hypothetical protein
MRITEVFSRTVPVGLCTGKGRRFKEKGRDPALRLPAQPVTLAA